PRQSPMPTPGPSVARQLTQIFASVKQAARPTLLIFDTFELAGEAERWVKDNLLLDVIRPRWLRVIIVGQRVPTPHGEPWEDVSSQPIELRPPTPEEWFTYGKPYKTVPEFTIEFVRDAYTIANGKSSILAELFGPKKA